MLRRFPRLNEIIVWVLDILGNFAQACDGHMKRSPLFFLFLLLWKLVFNIHIFTFERLLLMQPVQFHKLDSSVLTLSLQTNPGRGLRLTTKAETSGCD